MHRQRPINFWSVNQSTPIPQALPHVCSQTENVAHRRYTVNFAPMNHSGHLPCLLAFLLLSSLGCKSNFTATKAAGVTDRLSNVFVRIVTSAQSYDTMQDVMAKIKSRLYARQTKMSGGIITEKDFDTRQADVATKLNAYQPQYVLDIIYNQSTYAWVPANFPTIPAEAGTPTSRQYVVVLYRATDKQAIWYGRINRGVDVGGLAAAQMADSILDALEKDGFIVK